MVQPVYEVPSVLLTNPLSECCGGIRKSQRRSVIGKQKYTVKEKASLEDVGEVLKNRREKHLAESTKK